MKCVAVLTLALAAMALAAPRSSTKSAADHDAERQAMIDRINSDPNVKWTAGHNSRFRGQPIGASKTLCGVKEGSRQYTEDAIAAGRAIRGPAKATRAIPNSFDSATNWPKCAKVIDDIRDQSACGCCWAFGAASAASDRLCINTDGATTLPLSAQDTCFCAENNGCGGGMLFQAWHHIASSGIVTGGQVNGTGPFGAGFCSDFSLPHCHHHGPDGHGGDPYPDEGAPGCPQVSTSPRCPSTCDSDAKAPHNSFSSDKYGYTGKPISYGPNADAVAQAIMEGGPVETAFSVYDDFENYVGGIYHKTSNRMLGGHAVRIVGWGEENGEKYWKVANSWNPYWGEKGYFRIRRGTDECGIESQAMASPNDAKWGKK